MSVWSDVASAMVARETNRKRSHPVPDCEHDWQSLPDVDGLLDDQCDKCGGIRTYACNALTPLQEAALKVGNWHSTGGTTRDKRMDATLTIMVNMILEGKAC